MRFATSPPHHDEVEKEFSGGTQSETFSEDEEEELGRAIALSLEEPKNSVLGTGSRL